MKTPLKLNRNLLKTIPCLLGILLVALSPAGAQNLSGRPDDATDSMINPGPKQEAIGTEVMVSTQVPAATEAAVNVLKKGGN